MPNLVAYLVKGAMRYRGNRARVSSSPKQKFPVEAAEIPKRFM